MIISYQSSEGHTVLTDLSEGEIRETFAELTGKGYRAFAGTSLQDAEGPVKRFEEIPAQTAEIYFIAPLVGG